MFRTERVRDFSKVGDSAPIPNLTDLQTASYERFLQRQTPPERRKHEGLEALLREIFPMVSYDEQLKLEYVYYELLEPRYNPQECRDLRLTYGLPLRIRCRLVRKDSKDVVEESIYVGEVPIMVGGGEFIINGAERVIVSQLHRSPGVDFTVEMEESDRPLHGARIIPERGSWIELSVTKKDSLAMRIDQSSKIPATMFLRAMDEKYGTDAAIIREFHQTKMIPVDQLRPQMYLVEPFVDPDGGEEAVPAGGQVGEALTKIVSSNVKKVEIVDKVTDTLVLNTLAEDASESYENALLRIYMRLRPGNPPQIDKAKTLFAEKFFDENRYRLGKVGRFRINRKFHQDVPESEMTLRMEDFVNTLKYLLYLRSGEGVVDDIDHLGNRRLRTIDELATDELRKGFLKLRRTVQERMSLKDPKELNKIAELVNSKSISSSIEYFFGRGELSQVVDQQNPLSQLTHERRLSALGPGGLNRKRAGFEVRDVHISHYGRICPIETPEGNNIGLISSMGIYAGIDEYGFLTTPYRKVEKGKVTDQVVHLRADEEMEATLAPPDSLERTARGDAQRLPKEHVLARVKGELGMTDGASVDYLDISPRQTVGISAALIPFLEHDDANRALMGSNMQRQAVPLIRSEPPIVATGMEKPVAENSGMVVKARKGGIVTFADAERIVIDNADEYELRKFNKLNERACLNQKPIVKEGQRVKKGQIIADGSACSNGELALGRNVLVAFMPFDGYNFEDAILISERLLKGDVFTSIHLEEYDVEVRETKLGREEFTRDIPNVSERALRSLDAYGVVRVGTRVSPGDILAGKVSPKSKSELSPEEKLLHAIFGRAGEDVKNDSLELPAGEEGIVVDTRRFSRRMHMSDEQKKDLSRAIKDYENNMNLRVVKLFRKMAEEINDVLGAPMIDPSTRQKVGQSENKDVILEQIEGFNPKWIKTKGASVGSYPISNDQFRKRLAEAILNYGGKQDPLAEFDDKETLAIVKSNPLAFVIWVLSMRMTDAKASAGVVKRVHDKFGGIDVKSLAAQTPAEIAPCIKTLVAKPVAEAIVSFCQWMLRDFSGNVKKLWEGRRAADVISDLSKASGFTQYKLAPLLVNFLHTIPSKDLSYAGKFPDQKSIDVSADIHVVRVLCKLGLVEDQTIRDKVLVEEKELSDSQKALVQEAARKLYPSFPGALDYPLWMIGSKVGKKSTADDIYQELGIEAVKAKADVAREQAEDIYNRYWPRVQEIQTEMKRKLEHMKRGDELPSGVLEMVKVRVATKRKLGVGDKMAGRHGNKGVIAKILPEADMPFMEDGTPVDIVLNPLGVPSRMNVGQILETHLGWAAAVLGFQAICPVFDGATEEEIVECIREANEHVRQRRTDLKVVQQVGDTREILAEMPEDSKIPVYDGRTGDLFEQKVTVGYIYMNKLHHLVDEKIHARATGPYSLITQQPLGGKARTGGQRFGEMEVWGLEAYGASYTLQELLTVKSDDVEGRTKIYESMVKGTNTLEAGTPVSFDVLCNELRGLGLNIQLEKKKLI